MPSSAAQQWIDKALEDEQAFHALKIAQTPASATVYHAQQAAEKYIKAALVDQGHIPARTHDLQHLLTASAIAYGVDVGIAAGNLSAYAWLTRYPGGPSLGSEDVEDAEADLITIKNWALSTM